MILTRAPFRISFAGGGSDLPAFYQRFPGAVVSVTVDRYMYVALHPYFHDKIRVKYSRTEDVDEPDQLQHPLVRECLRLVALGKGMEIASFADVPAGSGLGSSSAFTVCLLRALHAHAGRQPDAEQLAREACRVEIEMAGEPIGKQDQYAAAYGGLNLFEFASDGGTKVTRLRLAPERWRSLCDRLLLFYLGNERSASQILALQSEGMRDAAKFARVRRMVDLAYGLADGFRRGDIGVLGEILHESWCLKRELTTVTSNDAIETSYVEALSAGAEGGKVLGAGGGGFLLLYCREDRQECVRRRLAGLRELRLGFSAGGCEIMYNDNGARVSAAGAGR